MAAPPALWDFACLLYSRDGVKPALLAMQDDHQLDIPFTLFALWAGLFHRALTAEEINALAQRSQDISANVVEPLRRGRRWLKAHFPTAPSPYQDLLTAELAAEKWVLDTLDAELPPAPQGELRGLAQALANVEIYLSLMNIPQRGLNGERLAAVVKHLPQLPVSN